MKIKGLFLLFASIVWSQVVSAAELTVENQSGSDLTVAVSYGSRKEIFHDKVILRGGSYRFSSGVHAFSRLRWQYQDGTLLEAMIPSTRTMLTGKIVLIPLGGFIINFDENGASSRKERTSGGFVIPK